LLPVQGCPTQVNTPHLNAYQIGRYLTYLLLLPLNDRKLCLPTYSTHRCLATFRDGLPVYRQINASK